MVSEFKEKKVVLTKPLTFESETENGYKAPNMIRMILSLFKSISPRSDLTRMQLPPLFNLPKSQLQCYGESVYCVGIDMLGKCNNGETPIERFLGVLSWNISILRPLIFGVAPYNPILGETHHVSRGTFNVLIEQVSHHPPVAALHATDEKENLELVWCQQPIPRLCGASVETEVHGTRKLKLLNHGETYQMNSPKLLIKVLPVPGVEWVGNDRIKCDETGLEAELCYAGKSFFGLRGTPRSIKGKIFDSSSMKPLYEIDGHWDRTITVKDLKSGELRVIYNAKEVVSGLKTPIVKDPTGVWQSESAVVWSEVSEAILSKDWAKAREAKKAVEEKQRELLRERESKRKTWVPKHFIVSCSQEDRWDCSPIEKKVPSAPIIVPLNSSS